MNEMEHNYTGSVTWVQAKDGDYLDLLSALPYRPRSPKKQNLPYKVLGLYVAHLAGMGASDSELDRLMAKGKNATMHDVAKIYCKNLLDGDWIGI